MRITVICLMLSVLRYQLISRRCMDGIDHHHHHHHQLFAAEVSPSQTHNLKLDATFRKSFTLQRVYKKHSTINQSLHLRTQPRSH